jgi:hypothetical protein
MDPTTIMAVVACGLVFIGWLAAPHRAAAPAVVETAPVPEREPALEAV